MIVWSRLRVCVRWC